MPDGSCPIRERELFPALEICCSGTEGPAHGKQNLSARTSALVGRLPAVLCTGDVIGLGLPVLWALIYSDVIAARRRRFPWCSGMPMRCSSASAGRCWAFSADRNQELGRGARLLRLPLMFLVAAWLFERAGMWFGGAWPPLLFRFSNNLSLPPSLRC